MKEGTRVILGARELDRDELLQYSQTVCDGLRDDDDGLRREVLAHAGSRWSLGVVHTLGVYGRLRHAEIGRRMHGVTQRMLTRTLRQLERDGLVRRHDFEEVPPPQSRIRVVRHGHGPARSHGPAVDLDRRECGPLP
ncbi:helix-turn-helix transcriptional regulator [Burkholderia sp. AU32262]|nr:helix-turn-helix transcriptional regulator [Burkholderia sp. AU32262]